jgi:hypothetical protein
MSPPFAVVANGKWPIKSHYPTQAKVRLDPDFLPRCARGSRVRLSFKERRMECINAKSLRRKSGQMGHPAFVSDIRDEIQHSSQAIIDIGEYCESIRSPENHGK